MDLTATDAAQLCGLSVRSVNALYTSVCVSAWLGSAPLSLLSQASLRPMSPLSAPSVSGANVGVARVAKPSSLVCSRKATVSIYRDRCRCLQSHTASHYSRQSGSQQHHPHRRLARLRRVGCFGFGQALSGQSRQQRIRQGLQTHVNGIESFWSHAKHRLAQFHGERRDKFALHLKETEFRFNHRHLDLYKTLLELLRNEPL